MTFALLLLLSGFVAPLLRGVPRGGVLGGTAALLIAGLLHDVGPLVDLAPLTDAAGNLDVLGVVDGDGRALVLLVAGLVWSGPAADQVVRGVLDATGVPAPPGGAGGLRAGRWIGRLERWLLVACVAAGQPALAVIPVGGKALFRYAEVVADARVQRPRLTRADDQADQVPPRDALVDYVIVGSLASWVQGIVLGLLVLAA